MRNTIIAAFIMLITAACQKPKSPEFVTVKDVKIVSMDDRQVVLEGIAIFNNPNSYKLVVKEIAVDVEVNQIAVGKVNQPEEFEVPAKADFEVPMIIAFSPKDVYKDLFSGLLDVLTNKKMDVYYKGFVRIKALGITVKVPIDHKEEIKI